MPTNRVAFYSRKGNSGKTTLTTTCAAAAARVGAEVLVLDADRAGDSLRLVDGWAGVTARPWRRGLADGGADLVLIDVPPDPPDARSVAGALEEADLVVVPVLPEPLQVRRLAEVVAGLPTGKPFAVVVNAYYPGAGSTAALDYLTTTFGEQLWKPPIPRRTAFPRSQDLRIPPQEFPGRPVEVVEAAASLTARLLTWHTPARTS